MGDAARRTTPMDQIYEWEVVTELAGQEHVLSCGVSDSHQLATTHLVDSLNAAPFDTPARGWIREIEVRLFGAPAYDRKALVSQAERCLDGRIVWTPAGGE